MAVPSSRITRYDSLAKESREWWSQDLCRSKGHKSDPLHGSRSPGGHLSLSNVSASVPKVLISIVSFVIFVAHLDDKHIGLFQGGDPITASVSGRADDLAYRCSSDSFDLDARALDSSENWAVLSTEGDKPAPRFSVSNNLNYELLSVIKFTALIRMSICMCNSTRQPL